MTTTLMQICDDRADEIAALKKELDTWKSIAIGTRIALQRIHYTADKALGDMPAGHRKDWLTEDVTVAEKALKEFQEHMIQLETRSFKEALQPRGRQSWTSFGGASSRS